MPYWERNRRLLQVDAGPSGNESFAKNEFWTGILQRNEMGAVLRLVYRTHGRKRMTISINVSVFVTYFLSLRLHVVSYNHTLSSITTHIGQIFRRRRRGKSLIPPHRWFALISVTFLIQVIRTSVNIMNSVLWLVIEFFASVQLDICWVRLTLVFQQKSSRRDLSSRRTNSMSLIACFPETWMHDCSWAYWATRWMQLR